MDRGDYLIAQISDTHIGSPVEGSAGANLARLDQVLAHLAGMTRRLDLLLVTGDLADADEDAADEDEASYRLLKDRLDGCGIPVHVCIGNHDNRAIAKRVFGREGSDFFHLAADAGPLRLIVLDTLEEGRHGGAFCEARADWLRNRLMEVPERPTLIALHHPPIDTGLDWLTTSPAEPWLARLDAALAGQRQVAALLAGHVHRPIASSRNGIPVRVCPSVAQPLAPDLTPLDPEVPDGRALVVDGPPGYALHLWREGVLTSHVDFIDDRQVLARFDEKMQPLVRRLFAERP